MAFTIKPLYGSSNQAITCTFTGLASGASRQSAAIDNSTTLYEDALVMVKVKAGSSGTSASGGVNVYAYATVDGGTTYTGGASGSDAGYTQVAPPQLILIGQVNVVVNSATYEGGPFSVASAFGGILPAKWGIVLENFTGATLDASVASAYFQGVNRQGV